MTAFDNLKRFSDHREVEPFKNTNASFFEGLAIYKELEERFQSILNSSKEGYFEINFKGDFTYISPFIS